MTVSNKQVKPEITNTIYSPEMKRDIPFPADDDALLDETQAAAFIGVTRRAMQTWRGNGKGPKYVRISARCIRYTIPYLKEWSEKRLRTSTSQMGGQDAR